MITFEAADGSKLTDLHIRTLSVNSIAGSLSLTYMLGNLLYRFVTDEDTFTSVLRADRSLVPMAVEESLRFEPPVLFLFRTAKEDVEVGGCPIHKGERVILGMASANRDEAVWRTLTSSVSTETPSHWSMWASAKGRTCASATTSPG